MMLCILLFIPGDYAGQCFIGFAIGESLGAAALRIAGGIFTKIADIGSDLMKIVFNVKEDDARNPGVIADCVGDNAGDSVGPSADGFETYGVTGVALISFILLAVPDATVQVQLLVWIFVMRIVMIIASGVSYLINGAIAKARFENSDDMNYETPLTTLVWLTSFVSVAFTYLVSKMIIPTLGDGTLWWKLSTVITCGTLAGAIIPELVKVFTSTRSRHVREVVSSSREGGSALNILSGLVAGNFSAYWLGMAIMGLMAAGYYVSLGIPAITPGAAATDGLMLAPAVFAFGLVAFGFLGMGPVTIAVDSYGPVTDNAQSVFELSIIEQLPGIEQELQSKYGFKVNFERAKHLLEENDGAGNTFKATAKPVLIGTAVVGATTMIFSIIVALTKGLQPELIGNLSLLHPPFLLGLITGGAMIYWFTGASIQAVTTGAYRAVEYIKDEHQARGRDQGVDGGQQGRRRDLHASTRRRGCSTSSSASSSRRSPSRSSSRTSSLAISSRSRSSGSTRPCSWRMPAARGTTRRRSSRWSSSRKARRCTRRRWSATSSAIRSRIRRRWRSIRSSSSRRCSACSRWSWRFRSARSTA